MMSQVQETEVPTEQPAQEQYQSIDLTESTVQPDQQVSSQTEETNDENELLPDNQETNTSESNNEEAQEESNNEDTSHDDKNIPSDESLQDEEAIEITEAEATTLSMDSNSEYEVMSMNGRFMKKRHHHDNECHTWTVTTWNTATWIDLWVIKTAVINWAVTGSIWDTVTYTFTYWNSGDAIAITPKIIDTFPVWFVSTEWLVTWDNAATPEYKYYLWDLAPGQTGQITLTGTLLKGDICGMPILNSAKILTHYTFEDPALLNNNNSSVTVTSYEIGWCGWYTWSTSTWSFNGRVFFDTDNNATLNTWETFVPAVTVLLKSSTWAVVQTLVTDMSGSYYGSAPVGMYSIEVLPLTWYAITTLNPENITLLSWLTYNAGDDGLYQAPVVVTTWSIDLWIKKTATVNGINTWNVWDTVVYTLTYGNTGSNTATWVVITDSFPIWFVSTGWLFSSNNQTWTTLFMFSVWSLAPGQTWQVTFTGTILIWTLSWILIPNIAQITSSTFENQNTLADNISIASVTWFGTWNCGCTAGTTWSFQWRVYYDNDNNAVKWGTDTYVWWVTVLVKSQTGLVLMTLTTDGSGNYNGVIWSWTYIIQVLPLPGYTVTTANPQTLAIIWNTNTDLWEDGLYKATWGGGWGWFGGGFTIIVPPTIPPVKPVEPLIPIGPNPEQPVLPTELLSSGPDLEWIFEESTTAVATVATQVAESVNNATAMIKSEATSLIQSIPIVLVAKMSSRPLTYVNVLSWFESALSSLSLIIYSLVAGFALIILSLYTIRVTTFRMN